MAKSGKTGEASKLRPFLRLGTPVDPAPAPTSSVGTLLCATRMRLGKDLQHVAHVLHIRYTYLVAIEDGRYEDLPGQAYAIGFVRAYADHLGLDGDEVVRRFKEESSGVTRKAILDFPLPPPDSGVPSGALILIAVVLGMAVYGVWYSLAGSDRSTIEVIQQVPDRLATLVAPEKNVSADAAQTPSPDASADGSPDAAATPATDVASADKPSDKTAEASPAPVVPAVNPEPIPTDVVELKAKADVWVTLRDAQKADHTQLLHKDEVFRVTDPRGMTLLTGKPSDLEILVNGQVAMLGDEGLFARGVALDPARLKGGQSAHQ